MDNLSHKKDFKTALTIAGSDPSGGAGFQADIKTFQSMGVYGLSIPSVLTAQSTGGISYINEVPADFFLEQIDALFNDILPDALKTGMLFTTDIIEIVNKNIKEYALRNLVVDPVSVSSTGVKLVGEGGLDVMKNYLFPQARIITPNIYEASVLTGIDIENEKDAKEAAVKLRDYGPESVIITGGHLKEKALDLLFDGMEFLYLESEMLEGEYHGTGCVFSASITACLALGYSVKEAFIKAKDFTFNAMKNAVSVGKGMKVLGI
jgi:hydroxymethylpyrimidine/phosphomethylpyrimidine kinase